MLRARFKPGNIPLTGGLLLHSLEDKIHIHYFYIIMDFAITTAGFFCSKAGEWISIKYRMPEAAALVVGYGRGAPYPAILVAKISRMSRARP